jgi:FkbM family methyltransferase
MKNRYFDFQPGLPALNRFIAYRQIAWLAARASGRTEKYFVDFVGYIDRQIIADGRFEKGLVELMIDLARETKHHELYVDVGANIGNHLVACAPHFKLALGIDPHPVLFHVLNANVAVNGLKNVELFNVGLASSDGVATLTESRSNHGLSRVKEHSKLPSETFGLSSEEFSVEYPIELVGAENFFANYTERLSRCMIKIDVEGMEGEIIEALQGVIQKNRPIVAFEWFVDAQPEILDTFKRFENYSLYGAFGSAPEGRLTRFFSMLLNGHYYEVENALNQRTQSFYPLAFMVPNESASVFENAGKK